jgi:hypothetical protein
MKGWGIPRTIYSDKHGAYTNEIAGLLQDMGVIWIGRRKGAPGASKRGKVENPFRHLNRAQEFSRLCPWESLDQINDWITARDARYCRAHRCASTGEIPEARWMRGLRPNARTMPVDEICKKMFRVPYERTVSRYTIHIPGEQIWLPHGVDAFRRMEGKRVMLYLLPWNNEVAIVRDSDGKEYELPRQAQPASAAEGLKPRALGAWEIEVNRLANADVPIARPKIVVPPPIAAGIAAPSVQKELVAKRPELDGPAPEKIIPVEHLRESLREGGLISRPITDAENAVINQHLLAGGGIRAADVSQIESELTALQAKSRVA